MLCGCFWGSGRRSSVSLCRVRRLSRHRVPPSKSCGAQYRDRCARPSHRTSHCSPRFWHRERSVPGHRSGFRLSHHFTFECFHSIFWIRLRDYTRRSESRVRWVCREYSKRSGDNLVIQQIIFSRKLDKAYLLYTEDTDSTAA